MKTAWHRQALGPGDVSVMEALLATFGQAFRHGSEGPAFKA